MNPLMMIGLWCIAFAAQAPTATETAEKRLAELLAPASKASLTGFATRPVPWPASRTVTEIALPVRPYAGKPAPLANVPLKEIKPRPPAEGTPLTTYREPPAVPKLVQLPAQPVVQLPSVNVNAPLPIPILAQPQKDRASLADPTLEASLAAALKPLTPARTQPVPFTPMNLPDPFEHVRAGQLRNPPDEDPMPPAIPLRKPTK